VDEPLSKKHFGSAIIAPFCFRTGLFFCCLLFYFMEETNMKKLISLLLVLCMVFALCACGTKEEAAPAQEAAPAEEAAAPVEEAAPAEEVVEEPVNALNISVLYESDDSLINNYTLIGVNPDATFVDVDGNVVPDVQVNTVGAKAMIDWLLSDECKAMIADFGIEEYGQTLFNLKEGAPSSTGEIPMATEETAVIRLSTTTSVYETGMLPYVLQPFQDKYGYTVEIQSAGTGKAIAAAKFGNADLIMVHSKSQEEAFIDEGYALIVDGYDTERLTFLYNFFLIVGPNDDPAGVKDAPTAKDAMALIAETESPYISRGDNSGTHTKEVSLWPAELGITIDAASIAGYEWYNYANAGQSACLTFANEQGAYMLTDISTWLAFQASGGVMG
jgi:ABC-type tungstate transport system permease subunit/predicted small lipoprotein YifL